jgi:hypothetical protein
VPDVPGYILSGADRDKLQRLFDEWARRQHNTQNRPNFRGLDNEQWLAPEVYIALTPPEGIPAVAFEPGTATSSALFTDVPIFSGLCQVYKGITASSIGTGTGTSFEDLLIPVKLMTPMRVFNYSNSDLPGGVWILIARDKFGTWFAVTAGGGGNTVSSDMSFVSVQHGPESGVWQNLYKGTILDLNPGFPQFIPGTGCWVWAPMGLLLKTTGSVTQYPYLGKFNDFFTHNLPTTGTGTGGPEETLPLYVAIGGWVADVICSGGKIQEAKF